MNMNYCVIGPDNQVVSWHETSDAAIDARNANDRRTRRSSSTVLHADPYDTRARRFTSIVLSASRYDALKAQGIVK